MAVRLNNPIDTEAQKWHVHIVNTNGDPATQPKDT